MRSNKIINIPSIYYRISKLNGRCRSGSSLFRLIVARYKADAKFMFISMNLRSSLSHYAIVLLPSESSVIIIVMELNKTCVAC